VKVGDGVYTIFDTGSTDVLISELWFENFLIELLAVSGVKDYEVVEG